MSHHFLLIGASYVRYVSIQILLKFQPPISYNQGWQVLSTWTKPSGFNQVKTVLSKTSWVDKTGQNLDKTWTKLGQNLDKTWTKLAQNLSL